MASELRPPVSEEEWRAFHDIRRVELFEKRGRFGVYDANHPDDRHSDNTPLVLMQGGRPVGVMRLDDRRDGTGVVRLVAVVETEQRSGFGRWIQQLLETICRTRGIRTLYVNAAPEAVGFYERTGWERFVWDKAELLGFAAECIQMRRRLPSDGA